MKTTVILDDDLASSVEIATKVLREKRATVLRLAIRAGLPVVLSWVSFSGVDGPIPDPTPEELELRKALYGHQIE